LRLARTLAPPGGLRSLRGRHVEKNPIPQMPHRSANRGGTTVCEVYPVSFLAFELDESPEGGLHSFSGRGCPVRGYPQEEP